MKKTEGRKSRDTVSLRFLYLVVEPNQFSVAPVPGKKFNAAQATVKKVEKLEHMFNYFFI
jgi:hypothetical protein